MTNEINNAQDIIDSRDVIARIEELKSDFTAATGDDPADLMSEEDWAFGLGSEDARELVTLLELQDEAEGCADWLCGEALIRESYFEEYAQQLAEDCGMTNADVSWPYNCIDWERAASELQYDYTCVDFDGVDYWIRS